METFTKFPTLPSELRKHALSFTGLGSLRHYSECSKQCNEDFGKQCFNKRTTLEIDESVNKIEVEFYKKTEPFRLQFVRLDEDSHLLQLKDSEDRTVHKGNYKQAAAEYLKNRLKYNWNGSIGVTFFHMRFWPFDAQDIRRIGRSHNWCLNINVHAFPQFYDSVKDGQFRNVRLNLPPPQINIPAKFFKTPFFQNLASFTCFDSQPEFDTEDFLTMKASTIWINCSSFSDEVINQKLCQYFNDPSADKQTSYSFIKNNTIDKEVVFGNLDIIRTDIDQGNEIIVVKHASGIEKTFCFINNDGKRSYRVHLYESRVYQIGLYE